MLTRLAVGLRPSVTDTVGQRVAGKIGSELHMPVRFVRIVKIFTIDGLSEVAEVPGAHVLHAGTAPGADGSVVSAGGRVLSVVATGADLAQARERAYAAVGKVALVGSHHRTDIALKAVRGEI